jgi:Fe-S-cluster-containing hydrogenase component 2
MSRLDDHPTVQAARLATLREPVSRLSTGELRQLCLAAGADDVGFVPLDRSELDDQRAEILQFFPRTRTLISIVGRMSREPIKSPARNVANLEFHETSDELNAVARRIVRALDERGVAAVNPAVGFPMDMSRFPGKVWVVSHKPVAVAAGLGMMGIHRNVIHPRFGNFILLGTILMSADVDEPSTPIDYNPCLECKLCVAACPVGAIGADGHFDFGACYSHNYREFMGGFTDWVEQVAASRSRADYRRRVGDAESASMWQSLSFGANYKAAYCLAVCPAGEDVIGPWLADRGEHLRRVVKPLQEKVEAVYVIPGSDAESHVRERYPHKRIRRVRGSLHVSTIADFLQSMHTSFNRGRAKGLDAAYHFRFTGDERREATVVIRDQQLRVVDGLVGRANLRITADSRSWVAFLARDRSLLRLLVTRKLRLWGSPLWLLRFGRCFPR